MMTRGNYKDKHRRRLGQIDVCPQELRFTQDSIKNTFKPPYDNTRIDEAVEQIRKKLLSPSKFKPLNVVNHNDILWSLDNRRLWVFRKAGVELVEVNLVLTNFSERSIKFFSELTRDLERQYSSATYFPRVRGPIRATESVSVEIVQVNFEPARVREVSEQAQAHVPSYLPPSSHALPPTTIEVAPRVYRSSNVPSLGKKAMDASWFILKKSFGFLRQAFNGERRVGGKDVRLALIAFSFGFMAGKAFNLGKKGAINVSSQIFREGGRPSGSENGVSWQDLIPGEGNHGKKVGSCQNMNVGVLSFVGYAARQAFVSIGSMVFSVSGFCLNKIIYWLHILAGHAFNIGKGVVASLGRNILCACRVCSHRIFIWLRSVGSQGSCRTGEDDSRCFIHLFE